MDKYAIMCIFVLVTLCLWHTVMSALVFTFTADFRVTSDMWLNQLDRQAFFLSSTLFVLIHLLLFTWLYFIPLEHRREMAKRDENCRRALSLKKRDG